MFELVEGDLETQGPFNSIRQPCSAEWQADLSEQRFKKVLSWGIPSLPLYRRSWWQHLLIISGCCTGSLLAPGNHYSAQCQQAWPPAAFSESWAPCCSWCCGDLILQIPVLSQGCLVVQNHGRKFCAWLYLVKHQLADKYHLALARSVARHGCTFPQGQAMLHASAGLRFDNSQQA